MLKLGERHGAQGLRWKRIALFQNVVIARVGPYDL